MKIYLAAAFERNAEMRRYRDLLEAAGHEITSRWIDKHGGTDTQAIGSAQLAASPSCGAPHALADIEDTARAGTMISFTGGGRGGRHVELGMAIIMDQHLVLVGPREHVFHSLPRIEWYPDPESWLAEWGLSRAGEREQVP